MKDSQLKAYLQSIVQEYGLGRVLRSQMSEGKRLGSLRRYPMLNGSKQRKSKVTAPKYVKKMKLPLEKSAAVTELAERFQQKSFLPTFHDVAEFCQMYAIEVPASRSRISAIPRVFKFIAEMEADELQRILDDGMFSGRLAPIADAIRNYSATSR